MIFGNLSYPVLIKSEDMTNEVLSALYEIEACVKNCPHLENINQSDPAVQYCMEQAKFHLNAAQQVLEAAVLDPQKEYDDAQEFYQMLWKVLPMMVLIQTLAPPPPGQVVEENSQDTQSSDQSDQDTFEPVTPSRPSEF